MTSLMQFQEFKLNQQSPIFSDSNDLQVFEDLLGGMELPTPPLSPDHADSNMTSEGTVSDNTQLTKTHTDLDVGETILQQMMVSEDLYFDSQETYGSDSSDVLDIDSSVLLCANPQPIIQDRMWNSDDYEPRHSINCNGIYTPAPSPPPEAKEPVEEDNEEEETENVSRGNVSKSSNPSSVLSSEEVGARVHPQAITSEESEEEIDVVTITDRPARARPARAMNKMNTRKRPLPISAPCSRQTSPVSMPPTKKRRCHSKRTQRLSSAGSNYGDGLESDDEQRRASHNVLERKRRNDLKYSFQVLRGQIPELEDNQRAPKVTILRKAAEYIKQIRDKEEELQNRMAKERRKESKLLRRLADLRTMH